MTTRTTPTDRIQTAGKFFRLSNHKLYVKGFSYGPFAPNRDGEALPEREQVQKDFDHIRRMGANTVRVYFPPPLWLLDEAQAAGLFVFIDIPWEKHRCFLEDWEAMQRARQRVRETARELGNHPAVFAISVVNEIPPDIVRFQGRDRVEQFIEELLAIAKREAPDCLVTFVNFPTTEFLEVNGCDFVCFNVYVHDEVKFGLYLDRLQHIAGNKPLLLGEYGIDSQREGDVEQAAILTRHLRQVFRHGLAGSVIFAYTDDWFTGGHQIDDWFFGVTRVDRSDKLAASALQGLWSNLPDDIHPAANLPKVSVVVCSYNGGKTLHDCLDSLMRLDYPDYEVILVDDGSTDDTASITEQFPSVICHQQQNQGLSVARNVGASLADGEIVAYTDDDCVADQHWLRYLVQAMHDQNVEAIGGPNITPDSDGWIAKCVAASPGNPSHVMFDDRHAEHVPGCNMAFRRSTLLGIGGFDPQFRVAGDDVDVCWRLLDAGLSIGYAAGAMVWHHRRPSVKAYAKQQQGYGRSEALVHFKHPQRCGAFGRSHWNGIIYGDGAVGLPLMPERIYHGKFGDGLFQTIYRHNQYGVWSILMSLEWHMTATFLIALALMFPTLALVSAVMWAATLGMAIRSAVNAPLPRDARWWCRPVVAYLYFMQPIWRGWHRVTYLIRNKRCPRLRDVAHGAEVKRMSACEQDLYWDNHHGTGREDLLRHVVQDAKTCGWAGDFDNAWADWDLKLVGDCWHDITIRVATEELGWQRRFTRARCTVRSTYFHRVTNAGAAIWCVPAVAAGSFWAMGIGLVACVLLLFWSVSSRQNCLRTASQLLAWASVDADLFGDEGERSRREALHPSGESVQLDPNESAVSAADDKERAGMLGLTRPTNRWDVPAKSKT
jgi:GT2 family glycosyltransferase